MTTVILTIKPIHLRHIRIGTKTAELRKTFPAIAKWGEPFRALLCESGSGGEIKAEFVCKRVEMIEEPHNSLQSVLQISKQEIYEYLKGEAGYLWHISDMVDYCSTKGYRVRNISEFGLKRPPQSWQYISEGACECAGLP